VGELIENSDYTQAKQDLAFTEGRIQELEGVLSKAQIIAEDNCNHKQVDLGCKVTVGINGKKSVFHLVGEWEADPTNQKISHESPLGQALIGKKVGEKVEIDAPAGKLTYTVLSIL
jgi:transcription elongation factor GreA